MSQHTDTIIVGGGQAGLSVSWHLKQASREHLILDRGKIGDTWRNRWDSFCLVTPNHNCQLPGYPYNGNDPDGFMLRDEIVTYVEDFAQSFGPPVQSGVEVYKVYRNELQDIFILDTSAGIYEAKNIVICTGTHQHPNIPEWSDGLSPNILQIHTRDYRNPQELPDGAVMVVGSGQSGCQVVEDLLNAGREIHLCVGRAGRLPRRYRGRDIIDWLVDMGKYEVPVDENPEGPSIRFQPHEHLSGRDGGRTIDLRRLAIEGVQLHGRLLEIKGSKARFSVDLAETLVAIDKECAEVLENIDDYIHNNTVKAPQTDIKQFDWQPSSSVESLDFEEAGIETIIYGTGFHYDFSWIDLPIFDDRGYPRYNRGVTEFPGLYFVGLHWQHTAGSGLFYQVGRDAKFVVDHLCSSEG